jgi:hypothetical protein
VLLARLVVEQRLPLQRLAHERLVDLARTSFRHQARGRLQRRQRPPRVAVARVRDRFEHRVARPGAAREPALTVR